MQINKVLKDYRKNMFIDCGIENHHSVFASLSEKDIANYVTPSVHRSLWTIVIHLFIINNIEINNYVEK